MRRNARAMCFLCARVVRDIRRPQVHVPPGTNESAGERVAPHFGPRSTRAAPSMSSRWTASPATERSRSSSLELMGTLHHLEGAARSWSRPRRPQRCVRSLVFALPSHEMRKKRAAGSQDGESAAARSWLEFCSVLERGFGHDGHVHRNHRREEALYSAEANRSCSSAADGGSR